MKKSGKIISFIIAFSMICPISIPAAQNTPDTNDEIAVLYTNDVHCTSDDGMSYAAIAQYKSEMEEIYGSNNVTLVDVGDAIQGGVLGAMSNGSWIIDIMNEVGYDLAVPGNHEFDFGVDTFMDIVKNQAQFPYISCNFLNSEGNMLLDGYKIVSYGEIDVAYVGISTPETITKATPIYFQDENGQYIYDFCRGDNGAELYEQVQKNVDEARNNGADYVIALGHLGEEPQSSPWMSTEVIANTRGIDALIDGHSHTVEPSKTVKNADGEDVLLTQTGTKAQYIGKLVIESDGTMSSELIELSGVSGSSDLYNYVKTVVEGIQAQYMSKTEQVVAKSDVDLLMKDPVTGYYTVRFEETNLGDLCADAYRIMLDADIGWVNGGGVRENILSGDITYGDIIAVHPFGNMICLAEVSGQQILDALELGSMLAGEDADGGFLQVSGIKYTINTAIKSSVQLDNEGNFVSVAGDRRVSDVQVLNKETGEYEPINPAETYTLATHNYMLKNGGDGYTMFGKDNINILKDEVMVDSEVLINYIADVLGGVVSEEYAQPQGRISIVNVAEEQNDASVSTETDEISNENTQITEDKINDIEQPTPENNNYSSNTSSYTTYTVSKGDSLWKISREEYGSGVFWTLIYDANKDTIENPNDIWEGQTINIPVVK